MEDQNAFHNLTQASKSPTTPTITVGADTGIFGIRSLDQLEKTTTSFCKLDDLVHRGVLKLDSVLLLAQLGEMSRATAGLLATELALSKSKTSRLVATLLESGLIAEHVSREDVRKSQLRVTGRGENVLFEITQACGKDELSFMLGQYRVLQRARCALSTRTGCILSFTATIVLIALYISGDGLFVNEICKAASLKQSKASMALRSLAREGFVRSTCCSSDRRQHLFYLTDKGMSAMKAIENMV